MRYKVIDSDGSEFGPISTEELRVWGEEGRLDETVQILDADSEGLYPGTAWRKLTSRSPAIPARPSFAVPQVSIPDSTQIAIVGYVPDIVVGVLAVLVSLSTLLTGLSIGGIALLGAIVQAVVLGYASYMIIGGRKGGFAAAIAAFGILAIPFFVVGLVTAALSGISSGLSNGLSDLISGNGNPGSSMSSAGQQLQMMLGIAYLQFSLMIGFVAYSACRLVGAFGPPVR